MKCNEPLEKVAWKLAVAGFVFTAATTAKVAVAGFQFHPKPVPKAGRLVVAKLPLGVPVVLNSLNELPATKGLPMALTVKAPP